MTFTVSGDAEHIYVSDGAGRIVATCERLADAERIAALLNDDLVGSGGLEPLGWLTVRIEHAVAEDQGVEALMLTLARDALDMNGQLIAAIRAHRFDTEHLVEKLGEKGYRPRLADQMLYEAAGLDRVEPR
jgi:hypothetical protein